MLENDYLTPASAGQAFNPPISGDRVRQLCDQGALKALRLDQELIPRSEIVRLSAERRQRREASGKPAQSAD